MNNKGFAVSGILYSMLLMFLVLIVTLLFNLQNKKTILDELISETVRAVEHDNEVDVLKEELDNLKSSSYIFLNSHPVGSIYITSNADENSIEAMNNKYGGTWQVYGAGKTLVGLDSSQEEFNTLGKTGGEKTHTLSVQEMPSHTHSLNNNVNIVNLVGNGSDWKTLGDKTAYYASITANNTGGDQPHNNLQPYITVYMYKRIA